MSVPDLGFLHIEDIENLSDVAKNVVTAAAVVVGGIWAYWRFVRERARWPRASVTLSFEERELDARVALLNILVDVSNEGKGLMEITNIRMDLHRVRPVEDKEKCRIAADNFHREDSTEADWPLIQHLVKSFGEEPAELEPGETDTFSFDFFLEDPADTVQAYVFIDNRKKKHGTHELGWTITALHDLKVLTPAGS
jgi:hypothetical protein